MAKKSGNGDGSTTPNTNAKTVSLTFSTPDELDAYASFAQAAEEDDRSINSYLVRVLIGKEENPILEIQPTN